MALTQMQTSRNRARKRFERKCEICQSLLNRPRKFKCCARCEGAILAIKSCLARRLTNMQKQLVEGAK